MGPEHRRVAANGFTPLRTGLGCVTVLQSAAEDFFAKLPGFMGD
jgi:hypothetical protein